MNQNKINNLIGLAGAFLLIIGVFCPVAKMPFEGPVTFFNNWVVAGVFVILIALASGALSFFEKGRYLWFPSIILVVILFFHLYVLQKNVDQFSFGNSFLKLKLKVHFTLEWGWFVLFGAVGLLVVSSVLCRKR